MRTPGAISTVGAGVDARDTARSGSRRTANIYKIRGPPASFHPAGSLSGDRSSKQAAFASNIIENNGRCQKAERTKDESERGEEEDDGGEGRRRRRSPGIWSTVDYIDTVPVLCILN